MPRKPSDLTCTDQFCGAGGSSVGAEAAGVRLHLAMNHWRRAIETHSENFPHAHHVCADVSQTDPRRYPSTNILVTSPECTHHTQARARKQHATLFDPNGADEAERSRATMMDVPRFAEFHDYEIIVVENVVEVKNWAGFVPWLQYMHNLGYRHQFVSMNSLIAQPTPQSRDRLYIVFSKTGNPAPNLEFRPPSFCPTCEVVVEGAQSWRRPGTSIGKYRQQYDYRCPGCDAIVYPYAYPAASAIDWTLPAPRIGDRAKALAPATRKRVQIGLEKFGFVSVVAGAGQTSESGEYVRAWPAWDPLGSQMTTAQHALATAPGWLVSTTRQQDMKKQPWDATDPFPTQTAQAEYGLATMPFLTWLRSGEARNDAITNPMRTVVSRGSSPYLVELRGGGSKESARSTASPLATVCASGNHHGLVIPDPRTIPAFYVKNYGAIGEGKYRAKHVSEPLGAITTHDSQSLITTPFLTSYYGNGGVSAVGDPAPTVTTRDRHALVEPASVEVDDCGFRMLEPHEIQAAMAFHAEYVVTGNKRERVRQLGNAVTPPVMQLLLGRCVESLA